ncbi:hypothetical protein QBC43DRAFT_273398 [Cladorrhinum sp. PSN259]|nr:hypothetical protein QBC43DRAFT_273398 [Cladorrhinum sp. PSN259]
MDNASTAPDRQSIAIAVSALGISVTAIAVFLRLYTRFAIVKSVGIDDWAVAVAFVFTLLCGISVVISTTQGLGLHVWTLQPDEIKNLWRTFFISVVLYRSSLIAVKVCFLLHYLRIFPLPKVRTACYVLLVVVGVWGILQLSLIIFQCRPISGFWDKSSSPECIPIGAQWYVHASGNIVTDIAIFVLPLPVLNILRLRTVDKMCLLGIFSLGFFTCAISIIRLVFLGKGHNPDFTFHTVTITSWSMGELACGMVCVCLPTLRPLLAKYFSTGENPVFRSDVELPPWPGTEDQSVKGEGESERRMIGARGGAAGSSSAV